MAECIVKAGKDYPKKIDQITEIIFNHIQPQLVTPSLLKKKYIKHVLDLLFSTFGPLDIWTRNDHRISFGSHKGDKGYGIFTIKYENKSEPIQLYIAGNKDTKIKLWPSNKTDISHPTIELSKNILINNSVKNYFDTVKEFGDLTKRLPNKLSEETEMRESKLSSQTNGTPDRLVLAKVRDSRSQQQLREDLLKEYGHKCLVTGQSPVSTLQAAHIVPHKDDNNGFNINNALLLRADIHLLIDRNEIGINPKNLKVEFKNSNLKHYQQYKNLEGKSLDFSRLSFDEEKKCIINSEEASIDRSKIKDNLAKAYENY